MIPLTIYRLYFTASDCYQTGTRQTQRGVQVHCTTKGASYLKRWVGPDDGRLGRNRYGNYHNRPGGDVCAHAYIGKLEDGTVACYQALPWDYRCWLSASASNGNANRLGYIGYEIAADGLEDEAYFREAVMGVAVNLTAHLCTMMGTTPDAVLESYKQGDALAVMDHHELAALKLASSHADISHWLKRFGLTMDDFRASVKAAMEEGVEVMYINVETPRPTIRKGSRGEDVKDAQQLLRKHGYAVGVDGIFGDETAAEVKRFQQQRGLTADEIIGGKTWAALEAPVVEDEPTEPEDAWAMMTMAEKVEYLHKELLALRGGGGNG